MNFLGQLCALSYSYNYQYSTNWDTAGMDEAAFLALFGGLMGFVLIVVLLCCIPFYVFSSIGYYTIAKRRGIKAPGLAWVPVANYFIIGGIGDDYQKRTTGKDAKLRIWMVVLQAIAAMLFFVATVSIIGMVISLIVNYDTLGDEMPIDMLFNFFAAYIPLFIGSLILLATTVLYYISLYRIYKAASPDMAVVFIVLSIFFSVIIPFVVFALRNKDDGLPQGPATGACGQCIGQLENGTQNQ